MSGVPAEVHDPPERSDGLARPIDFSARHGLGLSAGLSLGGGGVFFVAWQATYLYELATRGVDLGRSECVVGTSAGSLVATVSVARQRRGGHPATESRIVSSRARPA